ncbi:MAG: hypothetical protein K0S09_1719 [Sphingobacteriaceae bacterium]|jgi:hypothetical protein|nr:hypothetical protein [Sphingobacteriaceae bacterium]
MKTTLLSIILLLAIPVVSSAQSNMAKQKIQRSGQDNTSRKNAQTPEERAAKLTTMLGERLNLTDDQKDKIYEISLVDARRFEEEQKHAGKKSDDKPVFESSDAAIMDVLTEKQKEKYKKVDARKDQERNDSKQEKNVFDRSQEKRRKL